VSLSADGSTVAVGAPNNSENGEGAGQIKIFQNIGGIWTQLGDNIYGEAEYDNFGNSVSISADGLTVAAGADGNDGSAFNSGHVKIYQYISETWTQIGQALEGEAAADHFGISVSLSSDGQTVAVGANYNNGNGNSSGHVRVFQNYAGTWTQIGEDIDGEVAGDYSGGSVSLSSDGSTVAIGAEENDSYYGNEGHVRVYKNIDGNWIQFGADINGEAAGDNSGYSVSLNSDGTKVAIGSIYNGGNGPYSGHVRVYRTLPVDIKDYERHNISIYPNPSTDKIYFKFENNNIRRITIFDLTGKLIIQKTFVRQNETIDLSDFDSGIYTIEIQTDEVTLTKKILKK
jgi:Flp pilus assembly pilin Flp